MHISGMFIPYNYTSHSFPSSPQVVINVFRTPSSLFLEAMTLALTASNVKGNAAQKRVHVQAAAKIGYISISIRILYYNNLTRNPRILAAHLTMLFNFLRINLGGCMIIIPKDQVDVVWHRIH